MNTPRSCFTRSTRATLEGMTEWVWDPEREMNKEEDLIYDNGPVDTWCWRRHLRSKSKMVKVSLSSSPLPKKKSKSRESKKLTIPMRAMTSKKSSGWSSGERRVEARTVVYLRRPKFSRAVGQDQSGKRPPTWHKSCKESQKRGEDLMVTAEEPRTQGRKDDKNRQVLVNGLRGIGAEKDSKNATSVGRSLARSGGGGGERASERTVRTVHSLAW